MGSVRGKFFRGVEQTVGQPAEDNASDFSDSDDFGRSDLFHGLQRIFPIYLLLSLQLCAYYLLVATMILQTGLCEGDDHPV